MLRTMRIEGTASPPPPLSHTPHQARLLQDSARLHLPIPRAPDAPDAAANPSGRGAASTDPAPHRRYRSAAAREGTIPCVCAQGPACSTDHDVTPQKKYSPPPVRGNFAASVFTSTGASLPWCPETAPPHIIKQQQRLIPRPREQFLDATPSLSASSAARVPPPEVRASAASFRRICRRSASDTLIPLPAGHTARGRQSHSREPRRISSARAASKLHRHVEMEDQPPQKEL